MNMKTTESTTDFTTTKDEGYDDGGITVDETPTLEDNPKEDDGDFGYGEMDKDKIVVPDAPPVVTPPVDTEDKKKSVTGYGEGEDETPPAPVIEDKPFDPETATDEEKAAHEVSEVIKTLPDTLNKETIAKFAKDNNMTKSQVEAYGKLVKDEQAQFEKDRAEAVKTQTATWTKELREDPDFGGANFDFNVKQVTKVLENNLPNLKKHLTEKGGVLPPYLMKDLNLVAKVLYPKSPLVNGEAPSDGKDARSFLDDLY